MSSAMTPRSAGPSRRTFLVVGGATVAAAGIAVASKLVGAPGLLGLARKSGSRITGGWVNESASVGHRLRDGASIPAPRRTVRVPVEANRLNTQVLVRYYEQEWDRVNR